MINKGWAVEEIAKRKKEPYYGDMPVYGLTLKFILPSGKTGYKELALNGELKPYHLEVLVEQIERYGL
jgi:hypothetical protein